MRQGGLETAPRLLECRGLERVVAGLCQPTDQSLAISERPGLEEMVRDISGVFVGGTGIEPLDRVGDDVVQLLSARGRDTGQQRLTHKLMGEGKWPLRPLRAR